MPKPKVYNLSWFGAPAGTNAKRAPVVRHETSTIGPPKPIGAIILYPALTTPEILVGDQKLEILLLTAASEDDLRERLHVQLKISDGLGGRKMSADRALFVTQEGEWACSEAARKIEIKPLPFVKGQKISTPSERFSGIVDHRAHDLFVKAGYTNLFSVTMSSACLKAALGGETLSSCGEPQDRLIHKLMDKRNPWAKVKGNYFCFDYQGGGEFNYGAVRLDNPIQSYHPVYQYAEDELNYANLTHISDIHLAARQQVLAKTRARVIEFDVKGHPADLDASPELGSRVNVSSRDMAAILDGFAEAKADLLLIGGDLIDFLRSCLPNKAMRSRVSGGTPSRIWDAVALDDDYEQRYHDCVDMIAFYGMLLQFCRAQSMPAYAVSGNHDCYWEPYAISPRALGDRKNPGIPADHNLTIYEAILTFGRTYGERKSLTFPFEASMFDWFYMVYTPFADYAVELPNQHLVGFGWGDGENLLTGGQGVGHLPRSKDGVSDTQLDLLETAIAKQKKLILLMHFTAVSYLDKHPLTVGDKVLGRVAVEAYGDFDSGTFQKHRDEIYVLHGSNQRDIQIILTGHSHRRALYLIDSLEWDAGVVATTRHFDFDAFDRVRSKHRDILQPAIIVSDSGGPIPRMNLSGEFGGWGSDSPSGTVVTFDQESGSIESICAARAGHCRPRVAVALDFLDIQEKQTVITKFASRPFSVEDEQNDSLAHLTFDLELIPDLANRGLAVESVAIYLKWTTADPWYRIKLIRTAFNTFTINNSIDLWWFSNRFAANSKGNFLSMKFKPLKALPRYNFDDPWCWPFEVDFEKPWSMPWDTPQKTYKLVRNKKKAEKPDFDWLQENIPFKYT